MMKRMTKALCATLLIAAPLPAFAQGMPVHDSASLIQQINAVRQALQVVAQGKQQIAEAQKLYQDLNKLTDIPGLAQQLKSDALRELDISGGSLEGFGNGNLLSAQAAPRPMRYIAICLGSWALQAPNNPVPLMTSMLGTSASMRVSPRIWEPPLHRGRKGWINCAAGWQPRERRRKWRT
jgi:Type IV secretion system proteins